MGKQAAIAARATAAPATAKAAAKPASKPLPRSDANTGYRVATPVTMPSLLAMNESPPAASC